MSPLGAGGELTSGQSRQGSVGLSMRTLRAPIVALTVVIALVAAGCSSAPQVDTSVDPKTLAEEMIAGDLATSVGLGPLLGVCNDPGPLAVGTSFGCTATTEPGQVIEVAGVVNPEGRIQLTTTNLVSAAALPSFERNAAAALNNSVGSNFTAESVDCGNSALVLPPDFVMPCALKMPASGEVYDLTLTITDLDGRRFSLVVGDQPRP